MFFLQQFKLMNMKIAVNVKETLAAVTRTYCKHAHVRTTHRQAEQISLNSNISLRSTVVRRYGTKNTNASALFVTDADPTENSSVDIDLNLDELFSTPRQIEQNLLTRRKPQDICQLIKDYEQMKTIDSRKLKLESERNDIAKRMATLSKMKINDDVSQSREILQKRGREVKMSLKNIMKVFWEIEEKVILCSLKIPNKIHPDTPMEDTVIRKNGNVKDYPESRSHIEISRERDLIKFSNIGPKTYYLTGELAILERSIVNKTREYLMQAGLSPLSAPDIFRSVVMEGCGVDVQDESQVLTLQSEVSQQTVRLLNKLHIKGTSLQSFIAYLTKMKVSSSSLPLRYFSVGRQYHQGNDGLPGLFGALQSTMVVMFGCCESERESLHLLEEYSSLIWSYLKPLNIPIRQVIISAPSLLSSESLRYQFEIWCPSLQQYIQVSSISLFGEFISRRLMCIHDNSILDSMFLHMVGGEMLNITRLLAIMVEYNLLDSNMKQ